MRPLVSLILGGLLLSGCQPSGGGETMDSAEPMDSAESQAAAEAAVPASSAIHLFNGENLDGWEIASDGQFSVEEGAIRVNRGTGWLRSVETFGDFVLTMEFRFLEEGANSGIFVRAAAESTDDENGWSVSGYQVQCRDAVEGGTPLAHMIAMGDVTFESESDIEALKQAYRPTGEWHTYEIRVEGDGLSVTLNDVAITTVTGIQDPTGHIGIQAEGGLLEFRRVDVESL